MAKRSAGQRGAEKRSENGGGRGRKRLAQAAGFTHSDITTDEFNKRVASWIDTHKDARFGCQYNQMGYQPMRQLLDYLRENGFKTWIISGGGIDFMRVLSEKMYGIPPEQVVGSFALGEFSLTKDGSQIRKTMQGALMTMRRINRWRFICLWASARWRLLATAMAIWR